MAKLSFSNRFMQHAEVELPIVCGAMYPCSNPELVAAASAAGGLGVVQPITLTYVNGYDFRDGLRYIRSLTSKPIGMNALIESSSKKYHQRMQQWVDIALEEGVRFFITSLGKPNWVVDRVQQAGGVVYHDVTERKWALKGMEAHVDGLIAVNNRAGGHAGGKDLQQLYQELSEFNVPVLCAGGISTAEEFASALQIGYDGVQMGTRFIATHECSASDAYKQAVVDAQEKDIVLTERITGVPVSVIRTDYVNRIGTKVGLLARWLLRGNYSKRLLRIYYAITSLRKFKTSSFQSDGRDHYWQAGKSVQGIDAIVSVKDVMAEFKSKLL